MLSENLLDVHVTSLAGHSASYRMKGFFRIKNNEGKTVKVNFKGVAFGGHYGGHNVSVEISPKAKKSLLETTNATDAELEELISEIQRRMLNNEMIVEYDKLKPETSDALGNMTT